MWAIFESLYWIYYNITSVLWSYFLFVWRQAMWGLSSLTRDWTDTPCIGRWILNHWTTREVPMRENFDCTRCREWVSSSHGVCSMGWHNSSLETISSFFSQLCLSGSFTQASLSCSRHTCHGTSLHGIPSAQNTFLPFPLFNFRLGNPSSSLDSFPQD